MSSPFYSAIRGHRAFKALHYREFRLVCGGQVFGTTDKRAEYPDQNPVAPEHIARTVFHALGIDDLHATDREGRPFHLLEDGRPLTEQAPHTTWVAALPVLVAHRDLDQSVQQLPAAPRRAAPHLFPLVVALVEVALVE